LYTEHGVPKLCDAGDEEGYDYLLVYLIDIFNFIHHIQGAAKK